MKRAWGTSGDWYYIDYTVGNDPKVLTEGYQLKLKDGESIEARILALLTAKHGVTVADIKDCHIIRTHS